jgi:hypothetical protein
MSDVESWGESESSIKSFDPLRTVENTATMNISY